MKEKVKIVHLGYMHRYNDTRIFEKECKSIAKMGNVDITFITSNRGGNFEGDAIDGINIKTIPLINRRFVRLVSYMRDLKKMCMDMDGDIYHIHEHILLPIAKFLNRKGKKIIYDKHEETFDEIYSRAVPIFGEFIGRKIAERYEKYEKKLIEKSDGYIYVTPQHELHNISTRAILIPNFPKISDDTVGNYHCDDKENNCFEVAYCGGVAPVWSLVEFSNIIKKMQDVRFTIAGSGAAQYIEMIKENDEHGCINYIGSVPFAQVSEIYRKADMGIALLQKKLGEKIVERGTLANTKIYEYMKAGLPVVFTDFPIWIEMNEKYNFGIAVDLNDEKQIEAAVKYIKNNPREAEKMGKRARIAIERQYNWEKTEEIFLDMYRDIIKEL